MIEIDQAPSEQNQNARNESWEKQKEREPKRRDVHAYYLTRDSFVFILFVASTTKALLKLRHS